MIVEIVLSMALLVAGIAVLVVIHICVVGRAFRTPYPNIAVGNGIIVHGIAAPPSAAVRRISVEELQKLPRFDYKTAGMEKEKDECAVCLDGLKVGDSCRLLPNCMHSFHSHCIDSWLLKTPICPICRASAVNPPPMCRPLEVGPQDRGASRDVVIVELT